MSNFEDFVHHIRETAGLENMMEEFVLKSIYETYKSNDSKYCKCWVCLGDVSAIALNGIKPHYYSNYLEKRKLKDTPDYLKKQVDSIVGKAFDIVKQNPHH